MRLQATKWLGIEIRITKNSPFGKAHIMYKNNSVFMVQLEKTAKTLSFTIFVSNVYEFQFGMQFTPYRLNLALAN
jgi:hypothetical protein